MTGKDVVVGETVRIINEKSIYNGKEMQIHRIHEDGCSLWITPETSGWFGFEEIEKVEE